MLHVNDRANRPTSQRQSVISCDGKWIGFIEGGLFIKPVKASKHQLKRPPAWAVDAQVFDEQIKPHASVFRIEDKETGKHYEVPVDVFDSLKGQLDRGYYSQYFLPLGKWKVKHNGNGPVQLALAFGGVTLDG